MLTKNIGAYTRPEEIETARIGTTNRCHIYANVNIREGTDQEGQTVYIFDQYSLLNQSYTPQLKNELSTDEIIRLATAVEAPETTIDDLVDALNLLTEIVLGGGESS